MAKGKSTKKPTKKAAGAKQKPASKSDAALLKLAVAGDIDGIFKAIEPLEESEQDEEAYKWLAIAADFGHRKARGWLDDLLETSSLRYDDDQAVTGNVHWDLGAAYLTGSNGLPKDLKKAKAHIAEAHERNFPDIVTDAKKMKRELLAGLDDKTRAAIEEILAAPREAGDGDDDDGDY